MAKKINSTVSVAGSTNHRRSAAENTTLNTNEVLTKREMEEDENENEVEEKVQLKANRKRGVTDSLPATELRRSKRVKSSSALKEDEQLKDEKEESKKPEKKGKKGKKEKKKKKIEIKPEAQPDQRPVSPQIKTEAEDSGGIITTTTTTTTAARTSPRSLKTATAAADTLQAKKLQSYTQFAAARQSPYPTFPRPSASECKLAHKILASLHGARVQPATTTAPDARAGCGDSASVLDALVRTILSQNTSDANSTRAKLSMDRVYGSSCAWDAIAKGGREKLADAIACGGLAGVKSRVISDILSQTREKYGAYSLDHLFSCTDEEAMREMLAFKGVGPKTASCVLLFCLKRASFAVDTHVHRITGLLGWRPAEASRDQTHAHLDARIPDEDKYGLHVLLVRHGRECEECRAGGKSLGRCELRKAFRKGKVAGEAGEEVKDEEVEAIKAEEDGDGDGDGDSGVEDGVDVKGRACLCCMCYTHDGWCFVTDLVLYFSL